MGGEREKRILSRLDLFYFVPSLLNILFFKQIIAQLKILKSARAKIN